MKNAKNKILFLASAVNGEESNLAARKVRNIQERLRAGRDRNKFKFDQNLDLQVGDLQETLLQYEPSIVHLSAQVTKAGDLVLLNNTGGTQIVPANALAELFRIFNIRVIVLDGSYSRQLARKLQGSVDYVISMDGAIAGDSSVIFSTAFYRGLVYGRDVDTAFKLGNLQLQLEENPDFTKFVLHEKVVRVARPPVKKPRARFLNKSAKICAAGSV
jgi:hypothetical protein